MYRVYIYIAACTNRSAAGAMIHLPVLRVHRSRLYHSLPCSADGTTVGSVRGRAQFALYRMLWSLLYLYFYCYITII